MTEFERNRIIKAGGPGIRIWESPCPALDFVGRCSVYEHRPMICRLWGLVEDMPCHYGCKPERYLTRAEGHDFLTRLQEITGEEML